MRILQSKGFFKTNFFLRKNLKIFLGGNLGIFLGIFGSNDDVKGMGEMGDGKRDFVMTWGGNKIIFFY